jgi:hypothetical protein
MDCLFKKVRPCQTCMPIGLSIWQSSNSLTLPLLRNAFVSMAASGLFLSNVDAEWYDTSFLRRRRDRIDSPGTAHASTFVLIAMAEGMEARPLGFSVVPVGR